MLQRSSITMTKVIMAENTSNKDSALMYMSDADASTFTNCTFQKNKSTNGGNSMTINSSTLTISQSNFLANQAIKESSHIYVIFSTVTVTS